MEKKLSFRDHNPDVLECIANLSSDEVFTPPSLVNQILDDIAVCWTIDNDGANIWEDENVTFLNPFAKSGVFLREITKRLVDGLENKIPDLQERVEHILTRQVFGIAITKLTSLLTRRSLYCSKYANGMHSIVKSFDEEDGNIWFKSIEHTWKNKKCTFCGASKEFYTRDSEKETHAYALIHTDNMKYLDSHIFGRDMRFDVVIGNPPYQLSDGGHGRSASPIYHKFIEQAKKLSPRYLCMVIPARWYSGGKGLDSFRKEMLADKNLRVLVDFENSSEVFPGVDIAGGICYFLRSHIESDMCKVLNSKEGEIKASERKLDEFKIFIRQSQAISIIRKIKKAESKSGRISEIISPRKPFGIVGNYPPTNKGVPCHFTQKIGLKYAKLQDIKDKGNLLGKWKLLIPRAPIAGQTDFSKPVGFYYEGNVKIAKPGECCTESWLVAYSADSKKEIMSFKSYLFTKTFRFLLLQAVVSQDVSREKFFLVPDLGKYNQTFTDEILRKRWNITENEWSYIGSRIQ